MALAGGSLDDGPAVRARLGEVIAALLFVRLREPDARDVEECSFDGIASLGRLRHGKRPN
jgi:hypothetical protein